MANFKEDLQNIKAFVFDIDGVFTDGQIILDTNGEFVRSVNMKDGYAVAYALKQDYILGIISGGSSEATKKRFQYLGITDIYMKSRDKVKDLEDFSFKHGLKREEILYMGDDLPDYEVMQMVGLSTCPSDAAEEIKAIAKYISTFPGGRGCVRDVIEQVLRLQGKWKKFD
ncbi:MAG: HAD-IIIA family hydrolase [Bacteroidales bacterium]|jgi:3-deoxy-D-manno-octulosonate 8-phosphate phosphatase (KDO 8-P phosphatase)|nr:HAD-IIIA family hydrolase [Bacteroidales bacterium]